MTPRRVSPAMAALMLTAVIASAGRPTPAVDRASEPAARATQQQQTSKNSNTTAPSYARWIAEKVGRSGGNPHQRRNVKRQARRVLEKIGVITSGRQWKRFRRAVHQNEQYAELWQLALHVAKNRIHVRGIV